MAEVVRHVDTIEGTGVLTHTPVSAIFHDRPTALKVLSLRRPPKLAKERVYGPLPPPPRQWSQIRVDADSLCAYARRGGCAKVAADKLDVLYKQWADTAEDELADVTASSPSKRGRRGVHPRLMWRSLLPERTGRFGHTKASPSAAWAWLADVLRDASRLRQKTCELDAEEAAERYSQPVQRPRRNRRHRVQPRWPNRDAPRRDDDGGPEADRDEREDLYEALLKALDSELRPFDEVDGISKAVENAKGIIRHVYQAWGNDRKDQSAVTNRGRAQERLEAALEDARQRHREARGTEKAADTESWRQWIQAEFNKGARNAHLFSRLPAQWRPVEAATAGGLRKADPATRLDAQRARYRDLWHAVESPGKYWWNSRDALPRLSPSELREASASFRKRTTFIFDGFYCRH